MTFKNRTFSGDNPPKLTVRTYEFISVFRDGLFEFFSLFMLLYVQLASPIAGTPSSSYIPMFLTITLSLVGARILAAFTWTFSSHFLSVGKFKYGRYRMCNLIGLIGSTFFFLLVFFVAPLVSGWAYVALFVIFYTLMECSYSIEDIAYWSFINTLTSDENRKSKIASVMNLFVAIGTYGVASIAPAVTAGNAKMNLTILAMVLLSLDFIAEIFFIVTMSERQEPEISQLQKKTNIFEPMRILFSDKQILVTTLCVFLLFLAQDCLIGNSSTYFFYEYGYGSFGTDGYGNSLFPGGVVSFIFTICFGLGIAISQIFYPLLAKKMTKKYLLVMTLGILVFTYVYLFVFGFKSGNEIGLFVTAFVLAFAHGLTYMAMTMNSFDLSEYYEYKNHEDKNAPVQSLKAFAVISANGVQTGIFYAFLAMAGLVNLNSTVAQLEADNAANPGILDFIANVNNTIHSTQGVNESLTVYRFGLTLFPLLITAAAILLTIFVVSVNDEKKFALMTQQVNKERENRLKESSK